MTRKPARPVLAAGGQMTIQQSTEANTMTQYQWSPVSAVSANGSNQGSIADPQNRSVVILSR